jgi:hypothetical protein
MSLQEQTCHGVFLPGFSHQASDERKAVAGATLPWLSMNSERNKQDRRLTPLPDSSCFC